MQTIKFIDEDKALVKPIQTTNFASEVRKYEHKYVGKLIKPSIEEVKEDSVIVFDDNHAIPVMLNGEEHYIISAYDIVAVIEEE